MPKSIDKTFLIEERDEYKKSDESHGSVNKVEATLDASAKSVRKICPIEFNGLNIIRMSIICAIIAITIALAISIIFGPSQIKQHGAILVDDKFCLSSGAALLRKKNSNAIDALVSSVICLTVTRPDIASIGGCAAFLVHKRDDNTNSLFDAMCAAPNGIVDVDPQKAYSTVGVPGLMAGLKKVHEQYGSLPWASLFEAGIRAAEKGFQLHPSLIESANLFVAKFPSRVESIAVNISNWSKMHPGEDFPAQPDLLSTLRILSQEGVSPLYSGIIGGELVKEMSRHFPWNLQNDLISYSVHQPNATIINFAGFNVKSFPSPFIGGVLVADVLGNLDLLNSNRPLNAKKLSLGDISETSIVLHRLIELTKFTLSRISFLGDTNDSDIGRTASLAENAIFESGSRKSIIDKVIDNKTFEKTYYGPTSDSLPITEHLGETFVLATDSSKFTVAATLLLGDSFGSGITVPNMGFHMNSALRLFSKSPDSLNRVAPRRRPLVPISPVLVETANQRCGHRFMLGSIGSIQGMIDIIQILTNAVLSLSNASCSVQNGSVFTETSSTSQETCFPLAAAISTKRLLPLLQVNSSNYRILLQSGFPAELATSLRRLGHDVVSSTVDKIWTGIVGSMGWTKYALHSAVDAHIVDCITSF